MLPEGRPLGHVPDVLPATRIRRQLHGQDRGDKSTMMLPGSLWAQSALADSIRSACSCLFFVMIGLLILSIDILIKYHCCLSSRTQGNLWGATCLTIVLKIV